MAFALVMLPATSVIPAYLGGTADRGYVEGDHYFVGTAGRYTEVSETAWRLELWVSRSVPWSVLVPGLAGLFLIALSQPPGWRPSPDPPDMDRIVVRVTPVGLGFIAAGAGMGWVLARAPWAALLGGWAGLYAGVWVG